MSKPEGASPIAKGDLVLTPSGVKATVLYLRRRTPHALVMYQDSRGRVTVPLSTLTKLPDSERTERSRKTRSRWAARKAMANG